MKVAIIVGSPKPQDSTSEILAKEMAGMLNKESECAFLYWHRNKCLTQEEIQDFFSYDAVIFSFPLYVDGIPSHLMQTLMLLEQSGKTTGYQNHLLVYAIVNCGFFEGGQTRLSMDILKNWCSRTGITWGMGIGLGGGPMLGQLNMEIGKGPKKDAGKAYDKMAAAVLAKATQDNLFVSPNFPRWLYIAIIHLGFRAGARQNGLRAKDLYRQL